MPEALPPVIATLIANTEEFNKSLIEAKGQMDSFTADVSTKAAKADASLSSMGSATGLSGLQASAEGAAGSMGALGTTAESAGGTISTAAEDAAIGVGGVGAAAGRASGDVEKAATGMERSGKRVGGVFQSVGKLGGSIGLPMSGALNDVGGKLGNVESKGSGAFAGLAHAGKLAALGIAGGFLAVGATSVHLATGFQSSTAQIASSAGISINAANKIGSAFLSTAGTTIYSAQQQAAAYATVAGQLGATQGSALNAKQAMGVMNASMDLAEATGQNLGSTTSNLATVMQAYGLKANQAGDASNVLYNASRQTSLGMSQVTSTVGRLHTTLGVLTPPLSQMGGLLVDLTKHGATGRQAIAAVSSGMTNMIKPAETVINDTQTAKAAFDALTPSLQALATQYQSGAITTAQLTKATNALPASQATLIKSYITASTAVETAKEKTRALGIETVNNQGKFVGMASVISQLHGKIQGMTNIQALATVGQVFGASAAQKMLAVIQAGPAEFAKQTAAVSKSNSTHEAAEKQAKTLAHQMELMQATVETLAVRFGSWLIPKLENMIRISIEVVKWLSHHKDVLLAIAILIGGPLVAALAAYTAGLIAAAAAEIVAAAPIIAIGIAVAAVAAGIYELYKHWNTVWGEIKRLAEDAWKYIYDYLFRPLIDFFLKTIPSILATVVKFFEDLPGKIVSALSNLASMIWSGLVGAADWVYDHVIQPVIHYFEALPGQLARELEGDASLVWHGFLGAVSWLDTHVAMPVINFFKGLPGRILSGLGDIVSFIWGALKASNTWINQNVLVPIVNFFIALPGRLLGALGNIVSTIWSVLKTSGSWIDTNVLDPIVNFFKGLPGKIMAALAGLGAKIWHEIISHIPGGGAIASAGDFASHVVGGIEGLFHIPHFAGGGLATRPTLAMVGEAGPELILNPQLTQQVLGSGGSTSYTPSALPVARGSGATNVTNNFKFEITSNRDPREIAREIEQILLQWGRSNVSLFGRFAQGTT